MTEFYYNLETHQVEEGRVAEGLNRMGPYATRDEAAMALAHARERNAEWEDDDRRWREDWDGKDDAAAPGAPSPA